MNTQNSEPKREIVRELLCQDSKNVSTYGNTPMFTFGDIKKAMEEKLLSLHEDDVIECGYEEGYQDGDSGMDPSYFFNVFRNREENDQEYGRRMKSVENAKEAAKKNRYESYLRLKKEFENE